MSFYNFMSVRTSDGSVYTFDASKYPKHRLTRERLLKVKGTTWLDGWGNLRLTTGAGFAPVIAARSLLVSGFQLGKLWTEGE